MVSALTDFGGKDVGIIEFLKDVGVDLYGRIGGELVVCIPLFSFKFVQGPFCLKRTKNLEKRGKQDLHFGLRGPSS